MNRAETALLLGVAAAFDQRTVGETDVAAWHEALAAYDYQQARDAVIAHYRDSTDRVMPAHIRAKLRAVTKPLHRPIAEVLAEQARY